MARCCVLLQCRGHQRLIVPFGALTKCCRCCMRCSCRRHVCFSAQTEAATEVDTDVSLDRGFDVLSGC